MGRRLSRISRLWALRVVIILATVLATSSTRAFHDGKRTCKDGEIGFLALLLAEGGQVFTFLSSQDPANSDTILCQIAPGQLVQVKGQSQGL